MNMHMQSKMVEPINGLPSRRIVRLLCHHMKWREVLMRKWHTSNRSEV